MDYLSSVIRTKINEIIDSTHGEFGKQIIVYKDAETTVVSSVGQYNSIYRNAGKNAQNKTQTTVSERFTARVKYLKADEEIFVSDDSESQIKISLPAGSVRIKVNESGYNYIQEAKRIDFGGVRYSIVNDSNPHVMGAFSPRYYIFYLIPIDKAVPYAQTAVMVPAQAQAQAVMTGLLSHAATMTAAATSSAAMESELLISVDFVATSSGAFVAAVIRSGELTSSATASASNYGTKTM